MTGDQTKILQWARRVRDFLLSHDLKSEVAELSALRQELDDALTQLTENAAAQEAITRQSRVQTTEIRRLRTTLRQGHLKPIVRMSRTMKLEINGSEITFTFPEFKVDNERLASAGDAMVTALGVLGPQFVARGFAPNFVEQLGTATKALRDSIDQRAAQLSRRTGATAAMGRDGTRVVQLVRVIDSLVEPLVEHDPELLAAWHNVVALRRPPRSGDAGVTPPPSTAPASTPPAAGATGQMQAAL